MCLYSCSLDKVGALQRKYFAEKHQIWRLFTCTWLHAGFIHLIVNLGCIIFVGIHLERDFGPCKNFCLIKYIFSLILTCLQSSFNPISQFCLTVRVAIIYLLSGFVGNLVCALFAWNSPVTTASGVLSGLLGAIISGLIRNWKVYTNKVLHFLFLTVWFCLSSIDVIKH